MATTTRVSAGRPSISRLLRICRLAAPYGGYLPAAPGRPVNSPLTIGASRPHATSAVHAAMRLGGDRESRIAAAGKLDGIDLVEDSKISSFPQKPTPLAP